MRSSVVGGSDVERAPVRRDGDAVRKGDVARKQRELAPRRQSKHAVERQLLVLALVDAVQTIRRIGEVEITAGMVNEVKHKELPFNGVVRSGEHTSGLQSHNDIV